MRWQLTYTQVNAWFRTALKCPGGYIATANTVDTLPQWKLWIHCHWGGKDQGQWWHVFVAHYLTFLAFCSWRKKTECWHLSLFKKKKRITMLESLIFLKEKKNYNADIWSWHCWLREKNGTTDIWGLFFGRKPFQAWRHNWWLIEHIDKVTKLLMLYFVAVFLQDW